jgi:hypothetical protein
VEFAAQAVLEVIVEEQRCVPSAALVRVEGVLLGQAHAVGGERAELIGSHESLG